MWVIKPCTHFNTSAYYVIQRHINGGESLNLRLNNVNLAWTLWLFICMNSYIARCLFTCTWCNFNYLNTLLWDTMIICKMRLRVSESTDLWSLCENSINLLMPFVPQYATQSRAFLKRRGKKRQWVLSFAARFTQREWWSRSGRNVWRWLISCHWLKTQPVNVLSPNHQGWSPSFLRNALNVVNLPHTDADKKKKYPKWVKSLFLPSYILSNSCPEQHYNEVLTNIKSPWCQRQCDWHNKIKTPPQTAIQEAMRPASKGLVLMSTRQGPCREETGVLAGWVGQRRQRHIPSYAQHSRMLSMCRH